MSSFLQKYKRQPKLFIDLPSQGKWYDADGNVIPECEKCKTIFSLFDSVN